MNLYHCRAEHTGDMVETILKAETFEQASAVFRSNVAKVFSLEDLLSEALESPNKGPGWFDDHIELLEIGETTQCVLPPLNLSLLAQEYRL